MRHYYAGSDGHSVAYSCSGKPSPAPLSTDFFFSGPQCSLHPKFRREPNNTQTRVRGECRNFVVDPTRSAQAVSTKMSRIEVYDDRSSNVVSKYASQSVECADRACTGTLLSRDWISRVQPSTRLRRAHKILNILVSSYEQHYLQTLRIQHMTSALKELFPNGNYPNEA